MTVDSLPRRGHTELTEAISAAIVDLYARFYGHDRTTATTYNYDNVVVCILEDILSTGESDQIDGGESAHVIDGRVAFQVGAEDALTAAIERLTGGGGGLVPGG